MNSNQWMKDYSMERLFSKKKINKLRWKSMEKTLLWFIIGFSAMGTTIVQPLWNCCYMRGPKRVPHPNHPPPPTSHGLQCASAKLLWCAEFKVLLYQKFPLRLLWPRASNLLRLGWKRTWPMLYVLSQNGSMQHTSTNHYHWTALKHQWHQPLSS